MNRTSSICETRHFVGIPQRCMLGMIWLWTLGTRGSFVSRIKSFETFEHRRASDGRTLWLQLFEVSNLSPWNSLSLAVFFKRNKSTVPKKANETHESCLRWGRGPSRQTDWLTGWLTGSLRRRRNSTPVKSVCALSNETVFQDPQPCCTIIDNSFWLARFKRDSLLIGSLARASPFYRS